MTKPEGSNREEVATRSPEVAGLLGIVTCEHSSDDEGAVVDTRRSRGPLVTVGMPLVPGGLSSKEGVPCPTLFKCSSCPNRRVKERRG